jgi:hypothetical protein
MLVRWIGAATAANALDEPHRQSVKALWMRWDQRDGTRKKFWCEKRGSPLTWGRDQIFRGGVFIGAPCRGVAGGAAFGPIPASAALARRASARAGFTTRARSSSVACSPSPDQNSRGGVFIGVGAGWWGGWWRHGAIDLSLTQARAMSARSSHARSSTRFSCAALGNLRDRCAAAARRLLDRGPGNFVRQHVRDAVVAVDIFLPALVAAVCTENLNASVVVMKSAQNGA